jgi:hypothetical protein
LQKAALVLGIYHHLCSTPLASSHRIAAAAADWQVVMEELEYERFAESVAVLVLDREE